MNVASEPVLTGETKMGLIPNYEKSSRRLKLDRSNMNDGLKMIKYFVSKADG